MKLNTPPATLRRLKDLEEFLLDNVRCILIHSIIVITLVSCALRSQNTCLGVEWPH